MRNSLLLLAIFINCTPLFSQINFENEKTLIEKHHTNIANSEILIADLNSDNTKDLITISEVEGYIIIHPNINGDYTNTQSKLILENQNEYPTGASTIDINNDGLLDIIVCNRINNKISWFRNLGNFNFSALTTLINISNGPNLTLISDIDNDGKEDIITNLSANNTAVVWLKNNGNGTFSSPLTIYTNNSYAIEKMLSKDLNNDGYPEIVLGDSSHYIFWMQNSGDGTFQNGTDYIYVNSGKAFDFEDINNDNYLDLIYASNSNIVKKLNLQGNGFGANQSTSANITFQEIKFKDIDQDGLSDLVGSNGTSLSYTKRLANGSFINTTQLINTPPLNYFIADDLNNDNYIDFIVPSYNPDNNSNVKKLSAYFRNINSNSYSEKPISFYNGAVFNIKIADLDNDGKEDIISSFKSIIWNKNKGNGDFTSYRKISNSYPFSNTFTFEVETTDIDNDNDIDIVASTNSGLEIYFNDGIGNFTSGPTITLPYVSRNIEVADLNGDMLKDIVMTFNAHAAGGTVSLAWIPNLTGVTFGNLTTIGVSAYGYEPYLIKCTDMDNDGNIDIVSHSNEYSRIHLHRNNGNGIFTVSLIQNPVSAVCIAIEDFDNDGDKDIFTGGNYTPGIFLIKNNNGVFANKLLIQSKKADALEFADLNEDGLKDLVGIATENSSLGTLHYYINNGTGFSNQILLNSDGTSSLSRSIAIGNLNNDNKPDIVNSFYFIGKVSYFLNSSTLSIPNSEIEDFSFYPVPVTETLNWKTSYILSNSNYDVSIYNNLGKLVYSKKAINSPSIDLKFLPKGIYIVKLKSDLKSYSKKIIKN